MIAKKMCRCAETILALLTAVPPLVPTWAQDPTLITGTPHLFEIEALAVASAESTHPRLSRKAITINEIAGDTRRQIFRRWGAWVLGGAAASIAEPLSAQFALPPEKLDPLPFPDKAFGRREDLPLSIQKAIDEVIRKVRAFQKAHYDEVQINGRIQLAIIDMPTEAVQMQVHQELFADVADILLRGILAADEPLYDAALRSALMERAATLKNSNAEFGFFFRQYFPDYFSRHSLFFEAYQSLSPGFRIPEIALRPLQSGPRRIRKRLNAGFSQAGQPAEVDVEFIDTAASLIPTPHDLLPASMPGESAYSVRQDTRQIFRRADYFESSCQNFVRHYFAWATVFPKLRRGESLTRQDESNIFDRAAASMMARGLFEEVGPGMQQMTPGTLLPVIRRLFQAINEDHEAFHIFDDRHFRGHKDRAFLMELRADIDETIGLRAAKWVIGVQMLAIRFYDPVRDAHLAHAQDYAHFTNRLAYMIWRQGIPSHASPTVGRFAALSPGVQENVYDLLAQWPTRTLWTLLQKMFEETEEERLLPGTLILDLARPRPEPLGSQAAVIMPAAGFWTLITPRGNPPALRHAA